MTDMTVVHDRMKAIATAHADYVKSSFEANKAYLDATIKAPDQAMHFETCQLPRAMSALSGNPEDICSD